VETVVLVSHCILPHIGVHNVKILKSTDLGGLRVSVRLKSLVAAVNEANGELICQQTT
jgi:hypothetical protein